MASNRLNIFAENIGGCHTIYCNLLRVQEHRRQIHFLVKTAVIIISAGVSLQVSQFVKTCLNIPVSGTYGQQVCPTNKIIFRKYGYLFTHVSIHIMTKIIVLHEHFVDLSKMFLFQNIFLFLGFPKTPSRVTNHSSPP